MADSIILMRQFLLTQPTVTSLLGTNINNGIYGGDLPEGFDPKLGPGIQISVVGGSSDPEIITVDDDLMQVRIWADVDGYQKARQLYIAVKRALHGQENQAVPAAEAYLMRCQEVLSGQNVTDPDTGWATVVARYQLMFRDI